MKNCRRIGSWYEQKAAEYLKAQGYQILEKNFRCQSGEIDLIAKENEYLVFVEVKYRRTVALGNPLEAVDQRKQKRIYQAAGYYLHCFYYGKEVSCRFDVVAILGEEIFLIRNAFGGI